MQRPRRHNTSEGDASTDTTKPPSWRRSTLNPGKIVCNKCGLYERTHLRARPLRFDELRVGGRRGASGTANACLSPPTNASTIPTTAKAANVRALDVSSNPSPHLLKAQTSLPCIEYSTAPPLSTSISSSSVSSLYLSSCNFLDPINNTYSIRIFCFQSSG